MKLELFLNFDGNCREAVEFYAKVFKSSVNNLMTYAEAPPDPNYPLKEEDKDRIMYAGVPVGDMTVMFMDMPSGTPVVSGNNISPTVSTADKAEIQRLFDELKEGGEVHMEPQKAFFSELYAMVKDKYGVIWQILHYVPRKDGQ
ncbi:VOC family protein [Candidatus Saccharibacteria bacterium]|nr:VOC family protein [Candidatus Saccharibacteria bacterium]